ncbi:MAG: VOC family protein [Desulfocapsaceae bacterium]|nr:VOC family protein [Desulfocapsaceae bacterium]
MKTYLDHFVVGAATLKQGIEYLQDRLGVELPYGGQHPQMGTHNCVTRLSDTTFLEIIAVDPDGWGPEQPRWFGLDDPHVHANLARSPRLLTWVVNTEAIGAALGGAGINSGEAVTINRGDLRWMFGVPDDGRLLAGGILPYIISWQTLMDGHPAASMADTGLRLNDFRICTPYPEWVRSHLQSLGVQSPIPIVPLSANSTAYLEVEFETPAGMRTLTSNE